MESSPKHPKFVRWALVLGIVVILNVFFSVVLALALPAPKYEDYCPRISQPTPQDAASCDAAGGLWTEYSAPPATAEATTKPAAPSGYCDVTAKCQTPFNTASEQHALYAFVVMIGLGIVALIIGLAPLGSSIVGSGLAYGGVVALIIGSASYWGTAGNWLRLVIATIALVALLYIAWRKFKD